MSRRIKIKVDANQAGIVAGLRKAGYAVQTLEQGGGVPDLLISDRATGQTRLIEVKMPGGKLTPAQRIWIDDWPGAVHVVMSADEALDVVAADRHRCRGRA